MAIRKDSCTWRRLLLSVPLGAVLLAATARADTYRNDKYGFTVNFAASEPHCLDQPAGFEHGIVLILDDRAVDCRDVGASEAIILVVAGYNAAEHPSIEAAEADYCRELGGSLAMVRDLQFRGLRSLTCRGKRKDGRVVVHVTAFGWDGWDGFDDPSSLIRRIIYGAELVTTPERLEADLARLRVILRNVEIFSPD